MTFRWTDCIPSYDLPKVAAYRGMTVNDAVGDDKATLGVYMGEFLEQRYGPPQPVPKDLRKRWAIESNPMLTEEELEDV